MKRLKVSRHLLIVIACASLIFAAGSLAHKAYAQHVAKEQAVAATERHKAEQADKARSDHAAQVTADIKHECTKEISYWNLLTAAQRKGKEVPACQNLVIVNP